MAVKPVAYWGKQDLLEYRDRILEKSSLRVQRARKAVERARRADAELAEALEEAERIEAGKASWDALWPSLVEAEEDMVNTAKVSLDDASTYMTVHRDLIREMKKAARGVITEE